MNRRFFLKTMGLGSIGMASAGYLMANSNLLQKGLVEFPPDELKSALTQYINRYFNGELFNPNEPLPNQVILVADSFEVEPVTGKNSIFDFADQVIEQCQKVGFDASSLKNGKIPQGMEVGKSSYKIRTSEAIHGNKIEGLKDYDALIKCSNPLYIKTTLPPTKWGTINEFEKAFENTRMISFRDKKGKIMVTKLLEEHQTPVRILNLKPNIAFAPNQSLRFPISYDVAKAFLNEQILKK
ncbi:hypothetical protein KEM09_03310 [Carboxylicivirga mesophila]|uniref:Uncharacterized protein n=1 Tax=Carboxylicivirga mesophila TaxID=1166478 RepID=A0ABS5K5Z9_9BACT|nr:hypothetical protein [Carboxylicivirga mesophila]MBS2210410.1 hypothetical protein [Carboxylicivirga mesophila]